MSGSGCWQKNASGYLPCLFTIRGAGGGSGNMSITVTHAAPS